MKRLDQLAHEKQITTDQLVKNAIEQAGSTNGAARLLGVSFNTLYYWLLKNKYQVSRKITATLIKK